MTAMNPWGDWIDSLEDVQVKLLANMMVQKKLASPYQNGHNSVQNSGELKIVRQSIEDCMVTDCPSFEDVCNLIPLYNSLAFRENLLIKGPKGTGKTLSVFYYAKESQTPLVILECSEDTKKRDLFGSFYMAGDETPFVLGAIPTAIDIANEFGRVILAFEEINALTPQVQKELNAILDFRSMVSMPQIGKTYRLNEGAKIWPVASMNPSVYGGTYDLNEDLRSRWDEVDIGYPNAAGEKRIIKSNVDIDGWISAQNLNPADELSARQAIETAIDGCIRLGVESRQQGTQYALSSRDLVRLVRDIQILGPEGALQLCACKFEGDDRVTMIERIKSIFKGVSPKKTWGALK